MWLLWQLLSEYDRERHNLSCISGDKEIVVATTHFPSLTVAYSLSRLTSNLTFQPPGGDEESGGGGRECVLSHVVRCPGLAQAPNHSQHTQSLPTDIRWESSMCDKEGWCYLKPPCNSFLLFRATCPCAKFRLCLLEVTLQSTISLSSTACHMCFLGHQTYVRLQ